METKGRGTTDPALIEPESVFASYINSLSRAFAAERDRLVLWAPVPPAIGIGVYFGLPAEPPVALAPLLLTVSLASLLLTRGAARLLALACVLAAAGFALVQWRSLSVAAPVLEAGTGAVRVSGILERLEPRPGDDVRIVIAEPEIEGLDRSRTPAKVRITVRTGTEGVLPGDRVSVTAVLEPPPEPVAPGAFDFARQAWFERIGGVGYALSPVTLMQVGAGRGLRQSVDRLRTIVDARVRAVVQGRAGAMASALLTGHRGGMAQADVEAMQIAGLAHLLAISGLHMGLVAATTYFLVRAAGAAIPALALRFDLRMLASFAAWLIALGYLLLAGATYPTQRAFIMTSIVLFGLFLGRRPISLRLVAIAALLVLILAPEALLSASFHMSFAAVVALVAVYERAAPRFSRLRRESGPVRRLALYFLGVIVTTIVAEIAIAPFAAFHFNRITSYGLIANIVAVPVMAFWVMPLGLLALALMPVGLEAVALVPMGWGVEAILVTAHEVAALPGSVHPVAGFPTIALALGALSGLWLLLWRNHGLRLLALLPLGLATVFVARDRPPDLLIGREASLVALVRDDGIFVSSMSRARYEREQWTRITGHMEARRWDGGVGAPARCDSLGCALDLPASHTMRRLAVAHVPDALVDDCRRADLLLAAVPVTGACPRPRHVVDRFDVWREGAHAIWIDRRRTRIVSVADRRGRRPWVRGRGQTE